VATMDQSVWQPRNELHPTLRQQASARRAKGRRLLDFWIGQKALIFLRLTGDQRQLAVGVTMDTPAKLLRQWGAADIVALDAQIGPAAAHDVNFVLKLRLSESVGIFG